MTTLATAPQRRTTAETLADEAIASYRQNGFVHIPGVLSADEATEYYNAAITTMARFPKTSGRSIFDQYVNVWTQDDDMKRLTLHPNVAAVAERLAGVRLRLWHDQILTKAPHNNAATEFHQDQPYWPHANSTNPISAWIALCDVPVEKGCMTFLPGSQARSDLPPQNLGSATSLMELAPDFVWSQRITVPLRAGDCTFHHGLCAHMATPNFTADPRVAHVVIFTDADTIYSGKPHIVTDPLGLKTGGSLEGDLFPLVSEIVR
jgi:ectoine hydroxylase-related dioxygenase (phytanoyl-CoA dioxygenase family)